MKPYTRKQMKESFLNDITVSLGLAATDGETMEKPGPEIETARLALHYGLAFGLITVAEAKRAVRKARPMTLTALVKNKITRRDFERALSVRKNNNILKVPKAKGKEK